MNIPHEIKIGFKKYKVEKVEDLDDGSKLLYGNIDFDNDVINICNKYSDAQQTVTLIHESIHGIDDLLEIDLTEDQVRKLGKGIYQFIVDNPSLFDK